MQNKHTSPRILFPKSVNEALEMAASEARCVFWAGGTGFSTQNRQESSLMSLPRVVIHLGMLEELSRSSRSESHLEVGAMVTLDRLASLGPKILPEGILDTVALIGNRPLRCRATLGGHIVHALKRDAPAGHLEYQSGISGGNLVPLLHLLEAKAEIRYLRVRGKRKPLPSVRRVPLTMLEGSEGLKKGEILTRISIPSSNWNYSAVEELPYDGSPSSPLLFHALARIEKSVLIDWHMALSDSRGNILRSRETEGLLSGRSLPMSVRDMNALAQSLLQMTSDWKERPVQRQAVVSLVSDFIKKAGNLQ